MIKRKFSISEQAGTPVAIAAASGGGTTLFTQSTHVTTNKVAQQASLCSAVGMADGTNARSYNGPVDVALTFSSVTGTGVVYSVLTSYDNVNFITAHQATITSNQTLVHASVDAPYVGVYAQKVGSGAGSAICTVSGVREMYRTEMIERS
tara:strand:+ start:928 stop:1377 length:450 start_codon:yes stop_codon:yes gene_type:complete